MCAAMTTSPVPHCPVRVGVGVRFAVRTCSRCCCSEGGRSLGSVCRVDLMEYRAFRSIAVAFRICASGATVLVRYVSSTRPLLEKPAGRYESWETERLRNKVDISVFLICCSPPAETWTLPSGTTRTSGCLRSRGCRPRPSVRLSELRRRQAVDVCPSVRPSV